MGQPLKDGYAVVSGHRPLEQPRFISAAIKQTSTSCADCGQRFAIELAGYSGHKPRFSQSIAVLPENLKQ